MENLPPTFEGSLGPASKLPLAKSAMVHLLELLLELPSVFLPDPLPSIGLTSNETLARALQGRIKENTSMKFQEIWNINPLQIDRYERKK